MWIKICANTNLPDALLATESGADALGFVFAESPRQVTVEQVAAITARLPSTVERVGVFYTLDSQEISAAVRGAGLTGVQLHGGVSTRAVESLADEFGARLRIIQTKHWNLEGQSATSFAAELGELGCMAEIDAVLVDSRTAAASGGTGMKFDWETTRDAMAGLGKTPLIVAGGLKAENVAEAIRILRPWGVDVASGVEASPGKKDPERLRAFIAAARAAV